MSDKKRGRAFEHEMLSCEFGRWILEFVAGGPCSERTLRNKSYMMHVVGVLFRMRLGGDSHLQDTATFWFDLFEKESGVKTLFYELGKIDDDLLIMGHLMDAQELLQSNKVGSIAELKDLVISVRKYRVRL